MSLSISVPCRMSLSLMSPVDFKKGPCRRVEFRGQGTFHYLYTRHLGIIIHGRIPGRPRNQICYPQTLGYPQALGTSPVAAPVAYHCPPPPKIVFCTWPPYKTLTDSQTPTTAYPAHAHSHSFLLQPRQHISPRANTAESWYMGGKARKQSANSLLSPSGVMHMQAGRGRRRCISAWTDIMVGGMQGILVP